MRVYIRNLEPMWAKYGLSVEVPDELSDEEAKERALELCHEGEYEVEWGPEHQAAIEGIDQEFEVTEVER